MSMAQELAALQRLTVKQLRAKFAEVFGEATNGSNRDWLIRRIAWRLQALAEGGLSQRAKRRAEELANEADLRVIPPRPKSEPAKPAVPPPQPEPPPRQADDRLPPAGTMISRRYKGQTLQVKVLAEGFEFEGQRYRSLSAVAQAATGSHCNGFLFFRLPRKGGRS
jgi:hypothetical protein